MPFDIVIYDRSQNYKDYNDTICKIVRNGQKTDSN